MAPDGREFSRSEAESISETTDLLFPKTRLCFCIPRYRSPAAAGHDDGGATWWARGVGALKKLREWSEIVAGPRWKTFIRRFNRTKSGGGGGGGKSSAKFQYDPLSYALNFDDGGQNGGFDEEFGFRNFSCRYAAVPGSVSKGDTVL